jgi:hypothetical protein
MYQRVTVCANLFCSDLEKERKEGMSELLNLLVSPHAVCQFQKRIALVDEIKARRFIQAGILQAANVKLLPDGNTLRVRTRRPFPFEFRAYCVFDPERGHFVVTTIVRGDSGVTRKRKRRAAARKEAHDLNE